MWDTYVILHWIFTLNLSTMFYWALGCEWMVCGFNVDLIRNNPTVPAVKT